MQVKENPELVRTCINRARDILSGKIDLSAVHYDGDRKGIHLSDLQGCPLLSYYQKTMGKDAPPNDDRAILYFSRGRAIEGFFARVQKRVVIDGISCEADGFYPEHGYLELKSTAEQEDFFDPATAHPEWLERIKGYCYSYKQTYWNLVVFFVIGNAANRFWWNIREFGKSKEPYKGIDLRAWRLSFTEGEISENWVIMKDRKYALEECIRLNTHPSLPTGIEEWRCKICQMKDICAYLEEKNKDNIVDAIFDASFKTEEE